MWALVRALLNVSPMNTNLISYKIGFLGIALSLAGIVTGCSSSDNGAQKSGVAPEKPVAGLSAADIAKVCDWAAGLKGGYGKTTVMECNGHKVEIETPKSQAECVSDFQSEISKDCKATVADLEACANRPQTCSTEVPAECKAILECQNHSAEHPAGTDPNKPQTNPEPKPEPKPDPTTEPTTELGPSTRLGTLNDAQRGVVCDATNAKMGGYGKTKTATCADGQTAAVKSADSREVCIKDMANVPATCAATVKDADDCLVGMYADPCAPLPAACNRIMACAR
jgi:hypothetical protein